MSEILVFILNSLLQIIWRVQMKFFGIPENYLIKVDIKVIKKTFDGKNTIILGRSYRTGSIYDNLLLSVNFPQEKLPDNLGIIGSRLKIEGVISSKNKDPEFGERLYVLEQCSWHLN